MIVSSRLIDRVLPTTRPESPRRVADGPFRSMPGSDNIWVPVWSRRAAMAGLSLHASCRPTVIAAHHAVWGAVGLAGPRIMPGPAVPWLPPMPVATWQGLCDHWTDRLESYDGIAIYERPQSQRVGFGVLVFQHDRPVAFVKVQRGDPRGDTTWNALSAMAANPLRDCEVPLPLARGEFEGWTWMASSAIPGRPHRLAHRPPIQRIAADISDRLRTALDPTDDVPAHWEPMHGDLAPWNLRRVGLRGLWLLDWDDCGWGPPGADAVYYEATSSVVRRRRPASGTAPEETIRFWVDRVEARLRAGIDRTYNVSLMAQLSDMV